MRKTQGVFGGGKYILRGRIEDTLVVSSWRPVSTCMLLLGSFAENLGFFCRENMRSCAREIQRTLAVSAMRPVSTNMKYIIKCTNMKYIIKCTSRVIVEACEHIYLDVGLFLRKCRLLLQRRI